MKLVSVFLIILIDKRESAYLGVLDGKMRIFFLLLPSIRASKRDAYAGTVMVYFSGFVHYNALVSYFQDDFYVVVFPLQCFLLQCAAFIWYLEYQYRSYYRSSWMRECHLCLVCNYC